MNQTTSETGSATFTGIRAVEGGRARPLGTAIVVAAFAALTAVCARVAVPLPGTPVPFTLQVVAVLLSGFALGPRLGAGAQLLYLGAGLAGLPVFAAGGGAAYLFGPTGGYLLAFPVAAAVAGLGAGEARLVARTLWGGLAIVAIHAGGIAWITITLGVEAARAAIGAFAVTDLLKLALAVLIGSRLRPRVARLLG